MGGVLREKRGCSRKNDGVGLIRLIFLNGMVFPETAGVCFGPSEIGRKP